MRTTVTLIIIAVVIIAAYLGYKWYTNKGLPKAKGGSLPSSSDIACATGAITGTGKITGSCTKPKMYPLPSGYKEKCFTSDDLGLNEGDQGYSIVTDMNGFGTKWYFNYQSGNNFCYTNKPV